MANLDLSILEEWLDGIKYAETRGYRDPANTIGDQGLANPAYGAYQMRKPAFSDVQRLRPQTLSAYPKIDSVDDIMGNEPLQRALAAAYLDILMTDYRLKTPEAAVVGYNWGVGNVRKHGITGKGKAYLDTVNEGRAKRKKSWLPK